MCKTCDEIDELIKALKAGPLTPEQAERVVELLEAQKDAIGDAVWENF